MRDDVLERMHMAEQDDDDDDADLKQLRQLRQVWLAMPDEDPPTRGLDALMAAARVQAETMQPKPSWWKRMLATMVRPPALAMATIVVVAGGAVLVNRHHDEIDATRSIEVPATTESAGSAAAVAPAQGESGKAGKDKDSGEADFGGKLERKEQRGSGSVDSTLKSPEVAKPPTSTPAPQVTHAAVTKKPPVSPPPPAPPPVADDHKQLEQESAPDEVAPPKHVVLTPQAPSRPKPVEPVAKPEPEKAAPADAPRPTTTGNSRGLTTSKPGNAQLATDNNVQAQPESVDSMLRRAREAATRGDCATAKAIAAQIAKQDAAFYRNTTVKDAVVAKCL